MINNRALIKVLSLILFLISQCIGQEKLQPVRLGHEREAWLDGDINNAISLLVSKTSILGENVVTLYNRGYLYYLNGNNTKALEFLHSAIEKEKTYPYPYLIIARIYKNSGNYLGAKSLLKRGLAQDSDNYDLRLELGKIHQLLNEVEEAKQVYLEILGNYENRVDPRVSLASIYRSQKEYGKSKLVLEEKKSLYPDYTLLKEKTKLLQAMDDKPSVLKILERLKNDYSNSKQLMGFVDSIAIKLNYNLISEPESLPQYQYKIIPNEILDYEVAYGFITLGWLKIRTGEAVQMDGHDEVFPVVFYMDSNPSFDFLITLHHIYESYIDAKTLNAVRSRLYTPTSDRCLVRMYYFNHKMNLLTAYKIYPDGRYEKIEKILPRFTQDSTSLLYFARGLVSNNVGGSTAVVIDEEYNYGHINYIDETEEVDVGEKEIDAIKIFARAEFEGVAGMSGDAWGWFSPDDQAVPLVGKIDIIVGSITVQLEE